MPNYKEFDLDIQKEKKTPRLGDKDLAVNKSNECWSHGYTSCRPRTVCARD